jgi:divalent metal cation (Fe/Co/Zn/Cd) transporter
MSSDALLTVRRPARRALAPEERARLERRARLLAWGANAWHLVELLVAIGAGVASGSVALVAFGVDSGIEILAGAVVLWLWSGARGRTGDAERRAQQLIAASFVALAAYVLAASLRALAGDHPDPSWVGIALAACTAPTMPLLARAKRRVGTALGSVATAREGAQSMLCAYLSVALLVGLGMNALAGWWWADPLAGLVIAAAAVREGRAAWRGDACECC